MYSSLIWCFHSSKEFNAVSVPPQLLRGTYLLCEISESTDLSRGLKSFIHWGAHLFLPKAFLCSWYINFFSSHQAMAGIVILWLKFHDGFWANFFFVFFFFISLLSKFFEGFWMFRLYLLSSILPRNWFTVRELSDVLGNYVPFPSIGKVLVNISSFSHFL